MKHIEKGDMTMNTNKSKFEIRELDCWYYDDQWNQNTSFLVGYMQTSAKSEKRAFIRFLNSKGIYFKKNRTIIEEYDGGSIIEVQDRKTREPLYIAIYCEQ